MSKVIINLQLPNCNFRIVQQGDGNYWLVNTELGECYPVGNDWDSAWLEFVKFIDSINYMK